MSKLNPVQGFCVVLSNRPDDEVSLWAAWSNSSSFVLRWMTLRLEVTGFQLEVVRRKVQWSHWVSLELPDVIKLPEGFQMAAWTRSWTHLSNDRKVPHTVPVGFIDISQGLGEALWCLVHSWRQEQVNKLIPVIHMQLIIRNQRLIVSVLFLAPCGAVATATTWRPEQRWFPARQRWQNWEQNAFLAH